MTKISSLISLALGILLLAYGSFLLWQQQVPLAVASSADSGVVVESDVPTRLTIESLEIDLPIVLGELRGNRWDTSSEAVTYLASSPLPGEPGNSVLYGHNWPNLLGKLKGIKTGDIITLHFGTAKSFAYIVHYVSVVNPSDTYIYSNTTDARLTLYTCTGFLDSKRLVVTAILLQ